MMKRILMQIITACLFVLTAGCGDRYGANIHSDTSGTGVNQVLESKTKEADETSEETAAETTEELSETGEETVAAETESGAEDVSYDTVEVDLTVMSATMVYSEVYNMLTTPDNYLGKTVKMTGQYTEYTNETTGKTYFACIILDATACCAQGMEFALIDSYSYPADYPSEGEMISVAGVYDRYEEDGFPYYTLKNAVLVES